MDKYDPDVDPDPAAWLALDEGERLLLVECAHQKVSPEHPAMERVGAHASIHTIVENQLAMNEPAIIRGKLAELRAQGLTRHEAIHAIGSVLAEHMWKLTRQQAIADDYERALKKLSKASWYAEYGNDRDENDADLANESRRPRIKIRRRNSR